jgi:hypothetical protein
MTAWLCLFTSVRGVRRLLRTMCPVPDILTQARVCARKRRPRRLLPAKLRQRPGLRQAAPVTLLTYSGSNRVMSWTSIRNEIVSTKVLLLL